MHKHNPRKTNNQLSRTRRKNIQLHRAIAISSRLHRMGPIKTGTIDKAANN